MAHESYSQTMVSDFFGAADRPENGRYSVPLNAPTGLRLLQDDGTRRFFAALHMGPITGPREAVRAAIVAEARGK